MDDTSTGRDGFLSLLSRFWSQSYAADHVGLSILMTGYILMQIFVEPFHRLFYLSDMRIAFPHAETERVPLCLDFVYALFVPLVLLTLLNLVLGKSRHVHHVTVLGLAIALVTAALLTDVVKNTVGRPRPDLLARCKPRPGTPRDELVSHQVCTETDHHVLHDGWRSFPSGHSSFSFAGLGYAALFLAGQTGIFSRRRRASDEHEHGEISFVRANLLAALLCLVPLVGATLIAISRYQDYRHDVYDVCVGGLLGWIVAYWSYRRYWPRLSSVSCQDPYPGPGPGGDEGRRRPDSGYGRLGSEEEGAGPMQNVRVELELDRLC